MFWNFFSFRMFKICDVVTFYLFLKYSWEWRDTNNSLANTVPPPSLIVKKNSGLSLVFRSYCIYAVVNIFVQFKFRITQKLVSPATLKVDLITLYRFLYLMFFPFCFVLGLFAFCFVLIFLVFFCFFFFCNSWTQYPFKVCIQSPA